MQDHVTDSVRKVDSHMVVCTNVDVNNGIMVVIKNHKKFFEINLYQWKSQLDNLVMLC